MDSNDYNSEQSYLSYGLNDLLIRKGHKEMVFSANTRGHVFLHIVKFVATSLFASDELSKWVVL